MAMLTWPDCDWVLLNHSKSQYAEDLIMLPTLLHASPAVARYAFLRF